MPRALRLVDMGDHLVGMFDRIGFKIPHAAVEFFQILKQIVLEYRRAGGGQVAPKTV
jgi:hypothetical protein